MKKSLQSEIDINRKVTKKSRLFMPSLFIFVGLVLSAGIIQDAFSISEVKRATTEILYTINVGEEQYFIHFNVCAVNENIEQPQIIIISDKETVEMDSFKKIYAESCQNFESKINAKHPNLISILVYER